MRKQYWFIEKKNAYELQHALNQRSIEGWKLHSWNIESEKGPFGMTNHRYVAIIEKDVP